MEQFLESNTGREALAYLRQAQTENRAVWSNEQHSVYSWWLSIADPVTLEGDWEEVDTLSLIHALEEMIEEAA